MIITQTLQTASELPNFKSENMNGVTYPYRSLLADSARMVSESGGDILEWRAPGVDLDKVFQQAKGPVLEIGGPTEIGFYFLDKRALPSRPIIGNVTTENWDGSTFEVDMMIDGRDLPFADHSLGMVLSAHIPKYDYVDEHIGPLTQADDDADLFNLAISRAKATLELVTETKVVDREVMESSLRFAIAHEVYDKLIPGGLYLTDGEQFEIDAYGALGFELIASFDEISLVTITGIPEHSFSVVLRKPDQSE
jgi:hypothetical protein